MLLLASHIHHVTRATIVPSGLTGNLKNTSHLSGLKIHLDKTKKNLKQEKKVIFFPILFGTHKIHLLRLQTDLPSGKMLMSSPGDLLYFLRNYPAKIPLII